MRNKNGFNREEKNEISVDPFLHILDDPIEPENTDVHTYRLVESKTLDFLGERVLLNAEDLLEALCHNGLLFEYDESTDFETMLEAITLMAGKTEKVMPANVAKFSGKGTDALCFIVGSCDELGIYRISTVKNTLYAGVLPKDDPEEFIYNISILLKAENCDVSVISDENVWDIF